MIMRIHSIVLKKMRKRIDLMVLLRDIEVRNKNKQKDRMMMNLLWHIMSISKKIEHTLNLKEVQISIST
jgi:hypothetical protein